MPAAKVARGAPEWAAADAGEHCSWMRQMEAMLILGVHGMQETHRRIPWVTTHQDFVGQQPGSNLSRCQFSASQPSALPRVGATTATLPPTGRGPSRECDGWLPSSQGPRRLCGTSCVQRRRPVGAPSPAASGPVQQARVLPCSVSQRAFIPTLRLPGSAAQRACMYVQQPHGLPGCVAQRGCAAAHVTAIFVHCPHSQPAQSQK
jgi:hypothetical protein